MAAFGVLLRGRTKEDIFKQRSEAGQRKKFQSPWIEGTKDPTHDFIFKYISDGDFVL